MYKVGKKGNETFIINEKDDEVAVFDMFGDFLEKRSELLNVISAKVECMNILTEVDVLSIVGGVNKADCEIYFNGRTARFSKNYIDVYSCIKEKVRKLDSLVYSIKRNGYMQLILLLQKGTATIDDIKSYII